MKAQKRYYLGPLPCSRTSPSHDNVTEKFSISATTFAPNRFISSGSPTISVACSPQSAIVSAALNFQPGKWDCTISIPLAIQSIDAKISDVSALTGGEDPNVQRFPAQSLVRRNVRCSIGPLNRSSVCMNRKRLKLKNGKDEKGSVLLILKFFHCSF
jgi:hypothetical protein